MRPLMRSLWVAIPALLGIALLSHAGDHEHTLAILHVNVIPMDTKRILANQTIIVKKGHIATISDSQKVNVPSGAESVDASGMYMIPGLIDSHVHLYARQHLQLYVANGVTTVFNLDGRPLHVTWRAETEGGQLLGPRIFTVGPKFDRADPPEKAVELVGQYWEQGYDGIKIYNQVSKQEFPALVTAAKKHHMLIVGHVARDPGFEATVQAGQAIAHAEEYLYTFFKEHGNGGPPDPKLIPQAVGLTKAAGVPVIATLVTYQHILEQATSLQAFLQRPEMRYWAPWELDDIKDPNDNPYLNFEKDEISELQANYPFLRILVKALHDSGVPILVGTDSGGIANVPGFASHEDLQILAQSGLTPFEALQCATTAPARFLRAEHDIGTIENGKVADLVLLRANPLDDIANTKQIAGVVVKGRWLSRPALEGLLQEVPKSYANDERAVEEKFAKNPAAAISYLKQIDPFLELGTAVIRKVVLTEGVAKLEEIIRASRESDSESPISQPEFVNAIADFLLEKQRQDDAIKLFEFNIALHPKSAIAYDRLARAYYHLSKYDLALEFYKKALEVDPGYWNAAFAKRRIDQLSNQLAIPKS